MMMVPRANIEDFLAPAIGADSRLVEDAERAWRSGAADDDGATRPSPPSTTSRYLLPVL